MNWIILVLLFNKCQTFIIKKANKQLLIGLFSFILSKILRGYQT